MKTLNSQFVVLASKVNPAKVKIVLFVLSLALFVIGAGAPEAGGGIIGR